jgi:hypothetical protein
MHAASGGLDDCHGRWGSWPLAYRLSCLVIDGANGSVGVAVVLWLVVGVILGLPRRELPPPNAVGRAGNPAARDAAPAAPAAAPASAPPAPVAAAHASTC